MRFATTLALAFSFVATASPALAEGMHAVPTIRVSTGDLDLANQRDRAIALARIAEAADKVCHDYVNRWSADAPSVARCRAVAVRDARQTLALLVVRKTDIIYAAR